MESIAFIEIKNDVTRIHESLNKISNCQIATEYIVNNNVKVVIFKLLITHGKKIHLENNP
jgi:hypothetical protein